MHRCRWSVAITTAALTVGLTGPAVAKPPAPPIDHAAVLERVGFLGEGVERGRKLGHLKKQEKHGKVELDPTIPSVQSDTVAGAGEQIATGTTVVKNTLPATDGVVQDIEGGVRLLTVVKGPEAPTRFTYTFPGATLTLQEDGSVAVDVGEEPVGAVLPPWSVDADGNAVPTRYEVDGSDLVQVVQHAGAAYPVVSDPAYVVFCRVGWYPGTCVKYTRAETVQAYRNLHYAQGAMGVATWMCKYASRYAMEPVCIAVILSRAYSWQETLKYAYNNGLCFKYEAAWNLYYVRYRAVTC